MQLVALGRWRPSSRCYLNQSSVSLKQVHSNTLDFRNYLTMCEMICLIPKDCLLLRSLTSATPGTLHTHACCRHGEANSNLTCVSFTGALYKHGVPVLFFWGRFLVNRPHNQHIYYKTYLNSRTRIWIKPNSRAWTLNYIDVIIHLHPSPKSETITEIFTVKIKVEMSNSTFWE